MIVSSIEQPSGNDDAKSAEPAPETKGAGQQSGEQGAGGGSTLVDGIAHLVIDSGGIISGTKLDRYGPDCRYYTTPEVVKEIKDARSRAVLKAFPYEILQKEPSTRSLQRVRSFAKQTGDFWQLSDQDLGVLALALDVEMAVTGGKNIRAKPEVATRRKKQVSSGAQEPSESLVSQLGPAAPFSLDEYLFGSSSAAEPLPGDDAAEEGHREEKAQQSAGAGVEDAAKGGSAPLAAAGGATTVAPSAAPIGGDVGDGGDGGDDEGEWITPENVFDAEFDLGKKKKAGPKERAEEVSCVACVTTDYTMQNVMLQMRLRLLSVTGVAIKAVRRWAQQCYACGARTQDMSKKFCPSCGNLSLARVSYAVTESGRVRYGRLSKRVYNNRGTVFSVPKPKGGKHTKEDLVFREDAIAGGWQRRDTRLDKVREQHIGRKKAAESEYDRGDLFAFGNTGQKLEERRYGPTRRNVNEVRRTGNRKKRGKKR